MVLAPKFIDQATKIQNDKDFQKNFSSKSLWTRHTLSVKFSVSETIDGSSTLPSEELPDPKHNIEEKDGKKSLSTTV